MVFEPLYEHLSKVFPANQSGFRLKDSTSFQLTRIIHHLAKALHDNKYVFSCYFDISKAFDRVWHEVLLEKLRHHGVRDKPLAWIKAYLSNRRQRAGSSGFDIFFQAPDPCRSPPRVGPRPPAFNDVRIGLTLLYPR